MSVLNQSGEEQVECPLCMEPLEVDDLTFFPCTCGYQICRFCWHRIRTDENGLCPACRKAYPEDPADFKPLTQEEVVKLKAEKRHKDQQRKQRITENRKHLANVRVVQKNLVFVVGLPLRLADSEMLKKHEYFGKFGKIHKVVINQSTSYAGSQGPSASAYVTYHRSDDALRAIQSVNNIAVDGRPVKTSLGTTKYCSHFMKNQPCPKQDCMYLHELGDPEASFTKEQMQQGKHQEYEKKLHEQLQASTLNRKPTPSPPTVPPSGQCGTNKEAWPSLNPGQLNSSVIVGVVPSTSPPEPTLMPVTPPSNKCDRKPQNSSKHKTRTTSDDNRKLKDSSGIRTTGSPELSYKSSSDLSGCDESEVSEGRKSHTSLSEHNDVEETPVPSHTHPQNHIQQNSLPDHNHHQNHQTMHNGRDFGSTRYNNSSRHTSQQTDHILGRHRGPSIYESESNSLFSSNSYSKLKNYNSGTNGDWKMNGVNHHLPEVLPEVNSSEDWQAALGFPRETHDHQEQQCLRDDDLGFDPFHETQKALAELIEKEEQHRYQPKLKHHNNRLNNCSKLIEGLRLGSATRPPPPGFASTPNHMNAFGLGIPRTGSKILPYIHPLTFQAHAQPPSGWDWPSLDPAIVTSAQHCDLYANPPPGFQLRQPLDNL